MVELDIYVEIPYRLQYGTILHGISILVDFVKYVCTYNICRYMKLSISITSKLYKICGYFPGFGFLCFKNI